MQESEIAACFKQQVQALLGSSAAEPDGFRAYFRDHEAKDEEILGLLTISLTGQFQDSFPTPLEALAALSSDSRAEICEEFRRGLKTCLGQLSAA